MVATRKKKVADRKVCICFYAPKSILPNKVLVEVNVSQTWMEVLTENLGIQAPEEKGMLVSTWKYCVTNPESTKGWKCELNERVSSFISKFARKNPQYTVKICVPNRPSTKNIAVPISQPDPMSLANERVREPSAGQQVLVKTEVESLETFIGSRKVPGKWCSKTNTPHCWAYPGRNVNVLADNCLNKNLKEFARKKLSGVSELTFHRLKHQINDFNSNKKLWDDVGKQTPLICWFLRDLFEEEPKIVNGINMDIFKNFRRTQS